MKHIKLLSMDLQRFADDIDNPEVDENSKDEVVEKVEEKKEKTFTRAELAKMMAAERKKWESEELNPKLEQAKSEGEKYAQMTAEEKAEAESNKQAELLAKREADITRRELRAESIGRLTEANLPVDLVDALNMTSADECQKSFELIQSIWEKANSSWDKAIEVAVNEKLKASAEIPGASNSSSSNASEAAKLAEQQNKKEKAPSSTLWS